MLLGLSDSFGNRTDVSSGRFRIITTPESPFFYICPTDTTAREGDVLKMLFGAYFVEPEALTYRLTGHHGAFIGEDNSFEWRVTGMAGSYEDFCIIACGDYFCDTCCFRVNIVSDNAPFFNDCPPDTTISSLLPMFLFNFSAFDYDARDTIHFRLTGADSSIIVSDTMLLYRPSGDSIETVTIIACSRGLCDTCMFTVTRSRASVYEDQEHTAISVYSTRILLTARLNTKSVTMKSFSFTTRQED